MTTMSPSFHVDRASADNSSEGVESGLPVAPYGKKAVRTGRVLTGLATLFLLFDSSVKLMMVPEAAASSAELGWPPNVIQGLGVLELVCLALYLVPRTAVAGAVLWTGYLGGAIATHLRVGNPLFSHTLFPIYVALFIWGGLWLRDRRVRALFVR